jgi:GT2 family glycosyltransferase
VLVIDNGSDDVEITAALVSAHPGVEWLPLPDNQGFAAANNYGIACCTDVEFVALLNPDAFPRPEWLARLVSAAKTNPESASFASRLLKYDNPSVLDGVGDNMSIYGKPRRRGHGFQADGLYLNLEPVFCPSAAAALYRRRALVEVGGFDEDYFCYVEDIDLGFRLRLAGHKAMYVPDAVVHHVGSATTGGQHSDFSVYYGHRNLVWTFVKNMPGALFWLLLPIHLLLNLASVAVFMARGQGGVILCAKWDAIKGLPQAWAKRKQIQAGRVAKVREIWRGLDKRLLPGKGY